MLHGYLSNKESFLGLIDKFWHKYRVIALDMPGFGKAKEIEFAYAVDDYVQYVKNELDMLGVTKCVMLGHSFGGRVAIKFAVRYPQNVDKIILADSAGIKPKRGLKYYIKIYWYKFLRKISGGRLTKNFGSSDYKKLSPLMKESFKLIVNEDLTPLLPQISQTALIIFGENDRETPLYMARKFKKKIPNSSFYIIKNAGHYSFIDNLNEFSLILSEFL